MQGNEQGMREYILFITTVSYVTKCVKKLDKEDVVVLISTYKLINRVNIKLKQGLIYSIR